MGRFSLGALAVIVPLLSVRADGAVFPEAAAAFPAIPAQEAVIVYRDGVQTLIVRTSYRAESPTVGWILPLPSEPTDLAAAEPGMFPALAATLQPTIHDHLHHWRAVPIAVLAVLVPLCLIVIFGRTSTVRRRLLLLWLMAAGIAATAVAFALSATAAGPDAPVALGTSRVQETPARRVGQYDVTVLRAKDASVLSTWLDDHGLAALDGRGREIVADYIAKGWRFVVARLRQDAPGLTRPHPLVATFATPQPVYPLRLTALAGGHVRLDLVVIADRRARAAGLTTVMCDRFQPVDLTDRAGVVPQPYFVGQAQHHLIGHPDVTTLMWPGCVVTRLTGDVPASRMVRDLTIGLTPFATAVTPTFYTPQSKRQALVAVISAGWGTIMVVLAMLYRRRRRPSVAGRRVALALLSAVVAAVLIAGFLLPVSPVETVRLIPFNRSLAPFHLPAAAQLATMGLLDADMTDRQLAAYPDILRTTRPPKGYEGLWQVVAKDRLAFDRSPGNFHVRREGTTVALCFYDPLGREYRLPLPPRPR